MASRILTRHHRSNFSKSLLFQRLWYLNCADTKLSTSIDSNVSTEVINQDDVEIVIPFRIKRGPTDILKALASTISKDHLAPHFKYEDDPYFIPASNVAKRSSALSKESGKKAARYFLEKYPDCFKCNTSEPLIKAFEPPVVFSENDDVTEEALKSCVESFDVTNSMTVYQNLCKKGIPISQATKQILLELLCFYNCIEPPREDYTEDRWFAKTERTRMLQRTWKDDGLAEKVFVDMDKDSAAYCAMIQGTAKYGNAEKAFSLYEELRSNNLSASVEVYNNLLNLVPFVKENGDKRWEHAVELMKNMDAEGISPDLFTMNALLEINSKSWNWDKGSSIALQTIAEMERLAIEPSLGSYYHILVIFCRNSRGIWSVLYDVINRLEGKEFQIRHQDDVKFFTTAMEMTCKVAHDVDLAYRINSLLEFGNNSFLIGSAMLESVYFQNFFKVLCQGEDFEKFMEIYEKYVPNTYIPELSVLFEIIRAIELNGAYKHLPKLCSDIILFEHTEREELMGELLRVIGSVKHDSQVQASLIEMVWSIIEKIDKRAENKMRRTLEWTGVLFGNILKTFLYGSDLEKSWTIMQRLKQEEMLILGYPEKDCFIEFCTVFLEAGEFDKVDFCVKFATDTCYPDIRTDLQIITNNMFEKNTLDAKYRFEVDRILQNVQEQDDVQNDEKTV